MRSCAIWFSLSVLSLGLQHLSAASPGTVEVFYSRGAFPIIARGLCLISSPFPFSIAELTVGVSALFLISWIAGTIRAVRQAPGTRRRAVLHQVAVILSFLFTAYSGFVVLWGLNYNRQPFSHIVGLASRPASVDDLAALCDNLCRRANYLRLHVSEDSVGAMRLNDSIPVALRRASLGYDETSSIYPVLGGQYSAPKAVFSSDLWSYTGIGGMYWPFTGEANVNIAVPASSIPATACHEMAHQRGFAREDEANYIAYVACRLHPDADFQYSGALLGLNNAMAELRRRNPGRYAVIRGQYSEGVARDLALVDSFWRAHEGPVERFSDEVNDRYLKANGQSDGVLSYGRMVDLLLAEYLSARTGGS